MPETPTSNPALAGKARTTTNPDSLTADYLCPSCLDDDGRFRIAASTIAIVDECGAEATDIEYDHTSTTTCMSCGHTAPLGMFTIPTAD